MLLNKFFFLSLLSIVTKNISKPCEALNNVSSITKIQSSFLQKRDPGQDTPESVKTGETVDVLTKKDGTDSSGGTTSDDKTVESTTHTEEVSKHEDNSSSNNLEVKAQADNSKEEDQHETEDHEHLDVHDEDDDFLNHLVNNPDHKALEGADNSQDSQHEEVKDSSNGSESPDSPKNEEQTKVSAQTEPDSNDGETKKESHEATEDHSSGDLKNEQKEQEGDSDSKGSSEDKKDDQSKENLKVEVPKEDEKNAVEPNGSNPDEKKNEELKSTHEESKNESATESEPPENEPKQAKDEYGVKEGQTSDKDVNPHVQKPENGGESNNEEGKEVKESTKEELKTEVPDAYKINESDLNDDERKMVEQLYKKAGVNCKIDCSHACKSQFNGFAHCVNHVENSVNCASFDDKNKLECPKGYTPCSQPNVAQLKAFTLKQGDRELGALEVDGENFNSCMGLAFAPKNGSCEKGHLVLNLLFTANVLTPDYQTEATREKLTFSNLQLKNGEYKVCIFERHDSNSDYSNVLELFQKFLDFMNPTHSYKEKTETVFSMEVGSLKVSD